MTRAMKPVKAEVNGNQCQEPHAMGVRRQVHDPVLVVDPGIEEDIESGEDRPVGESGNIIP